MAHFKKIPNIDAKIFTDKLHFLFVCIKGNLKNTGRDGTIRTSGTSPRIPTATVDHRMSPRLEILLDMPPVNRDVQLKHAWNQDDR